VTTSTPIRLLLISGSVRAGSTNAAVLATVARVAPPGVETATYDGLASLPHFNPDDDVDPLPPTVAALRAQLAEADAVVFSTPEYAGALPGSFKNLLDWTVGDSDSDHKPVAWINASATSGAAGAHAELRTVVTYTGWTVVDAACVAVPVSRADVADGEVTNPTLGDRIRATVDALVAALRG
jgi:NAD(P)H-dependent FMN reductase